MANRLLYSLLTLTLLTSGSLKAQEDPSIITIDRIYNSQDFASERFGPARWMEKGKSHSTLEESDEHSGFRDIVKYNSESGEKAILVKAGQLIPAGKKRPIRISDYTWSNDKQKLLLFTNTRKVWRTHTRGDYWVLDLKSGAFKQLGSKFPEATLMFTKFSPDNSRVAYVSEHNVYVEDLSTGGWFSMEPG
jgi:dipeptidyl-peptidase-4